MEGRGGMRVGTNTSWKCSGGLRIITEWEGFRQIEKGEVGEHSASYLCFVVQTVEVAMFALDSRFETSLKKIKYKQSKREF